MKKVYMIVALVVLAARGTSAQNLVVNGGFESYTNCPTGQNQLILAYPWCMPLYMGPSSSDLFNVCNNNGSGVPYNLNGYQPAHSGQGYAGIFSYGASDVREYLQAPLASVLIAGKKYKVEMYVNLSISNNSGIASDGMGIALSGGRISGFGDSRPLAFSPQIVNPPNNIITDTVGWTLVSGTFTATGVENWITIGNFLHDSETHIQVLNTLRDQSYFLIDDVSVTLLGLNDVADPSTMAVAVRAFPNPATDFLTISVPDLKEAGDVIISDLHSKQVLKQACKGSCHLHVASLPAGTYVYEVRISGAIPMRGVFCKI